MGYNIPINPRTCPFHRHNLDYFKNQQKINEFRASERKYKHECSLCRKSFKS